MRFLITGCIFLLALFVNSPAYPYSEEDHPGLKLLKLVDIEQSKLNMEVVSGNARSIMDPSRYIPAGRLTKDERLRIEDATPIEAVSIKINEMLPGVILPINPDDPPLVLPDPVITIDGRELRLRVIDTVMDIENNIRHVTAVIVGPGEGYARFSIDDRNGYEVGTIKSDNNIYRVISRKDFPGQQIVYKVGQGKSQQAKRFLRVSRDQESAVSKLELNHVRTEMVADIHPTHYRENRHDRGNAVSLTGGNLGYADLQRLENRDAGEIKRILMTFDALSNVNESMDFAITSVKSNSEGGYSVKYQQIINGIPVLNESRLSVNSHGKVEIIDSLLIDPGQVDDTPEFWLTQNDAQSKGIEALKNKIWDEEGWDEDIIVIPFSKELPKIYYDIVNSEMELEPIWEFVLIALNSHTFNHAYHVWVNARTGEVHISENAFYLNNTDFKTNVCRRDDYNSTVYPVTCEDYIYVVPPYIYQVSITPEVIEEGTQGQLICVDPGKCQNPTYKDPWSVTQDMEDWLHNIDPNLCCDEVGGSDGKVEILVLNTGSPGSDANEMVFYDPGTDTISFPAFPDQNIFLRNGLDLPKYPEGTAHEMGHAIIKAVNNTLSVKGLSGTDFFAKALNEGLSDILAMLYIDSIGNNNWIFGQSILTLPRDYTVDLTWSDYDDNDANGYYNGRIIGHVFYKLYDEKSISANTLTRMLLYVMNNINMNQGNTSKFDQQDFKKVLDDFATGSLQTAVNDVWQAMQSGGGGATPFPPVVVNGIFQQCGYDAYATWSVHYVYWTSSGGTTHYQVWYKPFGPYPYFYSFSTPSLFAYTWNTVDVDVKIKACNANGCSALSIDSYQQIEYCQ